MTTLAVDAAAPRVILIEGASMAQPVILDDWQDNHRFLLGLKNMDGSPPLSGRPYLDLQMFWGPQVDIGANGSDPALLSEAGAGGRQPARLYLATDSAPLVLDFAGSLHELGLESRAVLEEWGIPLHGRTVEGRWSSPGLWWGAAAVSITLALAASLGILRARSQEPAGATRGRPWWAPAKSKA